MQSQSPFAKEKTDFAPFCVGPRMNMGCLAASLAEGFQASQFWALTFPAVRSGGIHICLRKLWLPVPCAVYSFHICIKICTLTRAPEHDCLFFLFFFTEFTLVISSINGVMGLTVRFLIFVTTWLLFFQSDNCEYKTNAYKCHKPALSITVFCSHLFWSIIAIWTYCQY